MDDEEIEPKVKQPIKPGGFGRYPQAPKIADSIDRLSGQHELFCKIYARTLHVSDAALGAGYSKKSAKSIGSKLLTYPVIQERVRQLLVAQDRRDVATKEMVLYELIKLATSDIGEAFNDDGSLKNVKEMPEFVRKAIQAIEIEELWDGRGADRKQIGLTKRIKFWDKTKSLELLGKHLKMFTDKLEVEGQVKLEDLIIASNKYEETLNNAKEIQAKETSSQVAEGAPDCMDGADIRSETGAYEETRDTLPAVAGHLEPVEEADYTEEGGTPTEGTE